MNRRHTAGEWMIVAVIAIAAIFAIKAIESPPPPTPCSAGTSELRRMVDSGKYPECAPVLQARLEAIAEATAEREAEAEGQ